MIAIFKDWCQKSQILLFLLQANKSKPILRATSGFFEELINGSKRQTTIHNKPFNRSDGSIITNPSNVPNKTIHKKKKNNNNKEETREVRDIF